MEDGTIAELIANSECVMVAREVVRDDPSCQENGNAEVKTCGHSIAEIRTAPAGLSALVVAVAHGQTVAEHCL